MKATIKVTNWTNLTSYLEIRKNGKLVFTKRYELPVEGIDCRSFYLMRNHELRRVLKKEEISLTTFVQFERYLNLFTNDKIVSKIMAGDLTCLEPERGH